MNFNTLATSFVRRSIYVCLGVILTLSILFWGQRGERLKYCLVHGGPATVLAEKDFEFVVDFMGLKYRGLSGSRHSLIDSVVFQYGSWERSELTFLRDTALSLKSPDLVFFDIGAYVGTHSMYLSQFVREVHAFEPQPYSAERFRQNMELNGIQNVVLHLFGLGSQDGSFPFRVPVAWSSQTGSFKNLTDGGGSQVIHLPIKRGDDLDANVLKRIDIMKIDVEGFEREVLLGFQKTLAQQRPIIVLELNLGNEGAFANPQDVEQVLPERYRVEELQSRAENDPWYRRADLDLHLQEQRNIVAFPIERTDTIPVEYSSGTSS